MIKICWSIFRQVIHIISLWFLSAVQRTMLSYGRRLRWRNCPGLFSLWSTAAAHTGNSGCSSTWNMRTLVLFMKAPRDRPMHLPACFRSVIDQLCFVSVSAGNRAAGRLHTCCSTGGLQWTVNHTSLVVYYKQYCFYLKWKVSVIRGPGGVDGGDPRGR